MQMVAAVVGGRKRAGCVGSRTILSKSATPSRLLLVRIHALTACRIVSPSGDAYLQLSYGVIVAPITLIPCAWARTAICSSARIRSSALSAGSPLRRGDDMPDVVDAFQHDEVLRSSLRQHVTVEAPQCAFIAFAIAQEAVSVDPCIQHAHSRECLVCLDPPGQNVGPTFILCRGRLLRRP